MTYQQVGVVIFGAMVGINAAGLALDAALFVQGLPTVSDVARRNPWLAALIIGANACGLAGLALHFTNGFRPE
jgi:hypothetical protein